MCAICLDELDGPVYSADNPSVEGRLVLPCGHAFHGKECLKPTVIAQAVTGQVTMSGWTRAELSTMPQVVFRRTAPSCPCCRTPFTAGTYWPDLTQADHLYQQGDGTYAGNNPDYPPATPPADDDEPNQDEEDDQDEERGRERAGIHAGPHAGAPELSDQAQDIWAIVGHAVQNGAPDLPARTYQALQTWPGHHVPDNVWKEILEFLPLEDQTRLAHTSHEVREIVARVAPHALDPATHHTPGFIPTLYTQIELNTSLNEDEELTFIPGTGSDLTIGRGRPNVHGPGTLSAVTGGQATAHDGVHINAMTGGVVTALEATIGTVSRGTLHANRQSRIAEVTGGTVHGTDDAMIDAVTGGVVQAYDQTTVGTMTGGTVNAQGQAVIHTVNDGTVTAQNQATIDMMTGGDVRAHDQVTVGTMAGGTLHAYDQVTVGPVTGGDLYAYDEAIVTAAAGGIITATDDATVHAVAGNAHITAHDNAQVTIPADADTVHVDAHDTAVITAHSGTITIHGPGVTITSNGDALIIHENGSGETGVRHEEADTGYRCTVF
ncbi:F-box protein [Streptomyces sp. NPDC057910]|uniref:F-box protein n=1 Tax=Streptomyces sp. NPDC057910 TaxID=3346278 RepID=UPI0036E7F591